MTEEEKEVIDNLTMKAITSSAEAPDYPNCIVMKKDLITLLNLIQKQDKRLKRQFKIIQKREKNIEEIKEIAHKDWEERCRLTFELEKQDTEINKLNNVIDKLIFYISLPEKLQKEIYCEYVTSNEDCCWKTDKECKDCIKEYFMKEE